MTELQPATIVEQVASHLRAGILKGRWRDEMPGRDVLARDLGVSPMTAVRALKLLEREKILAPQGTGRRRRILLSVNPAPTSQRIVILPYEPGDYKLDFSIDLQHQLHAQGHTVSFASKSLQNLKMDVTRVARLVQKTEADAWIVIAGSREVLSWFAQQPKPAYALFGRYMSLPMPGGSPDKSKAISVAVRRLVELGHQRIVMLARDDRRKPEPGLSERVFLQELQTLGVPCGSYNLPDWENSLEGFQRCLDSLFRHTPPTALIIQQAMLFIAANQYLAQRGILAPDHVSLICTDPDPSFAWCKPSIAHTHWDSHALIKQVCRWVENVARGRRDLRQIATSAQFVEGGTIGPVPKQPPFPRPPTPSAALTGKVIS
jgi:DNA-binding LacI/PurR family transcriptional regulator